MFSLARLVYICSELLDLRMKLKLIILVGAIALALPKPVSGQEYFEEQSVVLVKDHSPRKATLYSAVLPGLGQAYNKKYWKIPVIYAGFATMGYFVYFNTTQYNVYKQALIDFKDLSAETNSYLDLVGSSLNPETFDISLGSPLYSREDAEWFQTQLENNMNYYRRYRDLSVLLTGLWYVLNVIDATVDAHLFYYSISDDISMNLSPDLFDVNGQKISGGLKLHLSF